MSVSYKISLSYNQILDLAKQLPNKQKEKLGRELTKESTEKRWSTLISKLQTDKISESEITKEVEKARAKIYAKKK